MSKKKKKTRQRPTLGFFGFLLALVGLIIFALFLNDSQGNPFGPTLSLWWLYTAATAIGVAFDFQLAADVPNTQGDVTVDVVVTDGRILEIADR